MSQLVLQVSPYQNQNAEHRRLRDEALEILQSVSPAAREDARDMMRPMFKDSHAVMLTLLQEENLRLIAPPQGPPMPGSGEPVSTCFGLFNRDFEPSHQFVIDGGPEELSRAKRALIRYGRRFQQSNVHLFFDSSYGFSDEHEHACNQRSFSVRFNSLKTIREIVDLAIEAGRGEFGLTASYFGHQILVYSTKLRDEERPTEIGRIEAFLRQVMPDHGVICRRDIQLINFGQTCDHQACQTYDEAEAQLNSASRSGT